MKKAPLLWLLVALLQTMGSAQTESDSPLSFEEDIIALEAQLQSPTDTLGFLPIRRRIWGAVNAPDRARQYLDFLGQMYKRYPDITTNRTPFKEVVVNTYANWAWDNAEQYSDLAFRQLDTAAQISREIGFENGLWQGEFVRGHILQVRGDYEEALYHLKKAYDYYSNPFDSAHVGSILYQMGICELELGQLEKSIETFTRTVEIDEALGRNVYAYNLLGQAYRKSRLYDRSEAAYLKCYEYWKAKDSKSGQSLALMNLGNMKMEIGERAEAKQLFLRSVALDQGDDFALGYSTENLADWYLQAGQVDSAYHYAGQSYAIRRNFGNPRELSKVEYLLARVHMARGQHQAALPLLRNAYRTVSEQNQQEFIRDIARDLSNWYERYGDYQEALRYQKVFVTAKDSLLNEKVAQAVADVSEKYETAEKERTIEQLNMQNRLQAQVLQARQRQLLIVSIGSVLLIGLLLGIYSLYRQVRNQNGVIQKNLREKETLLKEIHHRVKNNLQIIASLLRIQSRGIADVAAKEAIRESRSRVRSMALIHEDLYKENDLSGVLMSDYLGKLTDDIFRIYNIAPDRIQLETDIAPIRLDVDTVIPIGLIVNELLTNALKHAFPGQRTGMVSLTLKEQQDRLMLEVSDNGQGSTGKTTDGSFGLSMIETFREKLEGELEWIGEQGTTVRMWMAHYQKLEGMVLFSKK